MKTIELMQPPAAEGQPAQTVHAIIDRIAFMFKQPLQPIFVVAVGNGTLPCIGDHAAVLQQLKVSGFTLFETPESGSAAVNKDAVLFYAQPLANGAPQLGQYALMFAGGTALTVKATAQDLENMLDDGKSSIILD